MELLETARKLSERDGTDLSRGEVAERATGGRGFGKGFGRDRGFSSRGFGTGDRARDDEDEGRPLKPPGQSFTP